MFVAVGEINLASRILRDFHFEDFEPLGTRAELCGAKEEDEQRRKLDGLKRVKTCRSSYCF